MSENPKRKRTGIQIILNKLYNNKVRKIKTVLNRRIIRATAIIRERERRDKGRKDERCKWVELGACGPRTRGMGFGKRNSPAVGGTKRQRVLNSD